MNVELQRAIAGAILHGRNRSPVVDEINLSPDGGGTIKYRSGSVWIDPSSPGFNRYSTQITDEELVRAYLLHRLATTLQYQPTPEILELERVYAPVGRPTGKGGRIDVLVRRPPKKNGQGDPFLFIECKESSKFDSDMRFIDGQLFRLSMQEVPRPKYLVYYTVDLRRGELRERIILVDTEAFPAYDAWDAAGQPIIDVLPARYGTPAPRRYANISTPTATQRPLDTTVTATTLNRIRSEIHDVIWGGGGTNNNEDFVYITKLILCKIFDEKESPPNAEYRFQRRGDAISPESPLALAERMNAPYQEAEVAYLALPHPSGAPAFDFSRISPAKVAYVVGRLEDISITDNVHDGDLLGEFFEQIVSQDFTQSKGQFFTPMHIVRFMLQMVDVGSRARNVLIQQRDRLGRPRLPYIIDPSVGSGSFLIEYMKRVSTSLTDPKFAAQLPARVREFYGTWFHERNKNAWAREFVYAIENNYDLGLAAKVNMVLHGDGSMNTFISSGLLPFEDYWVDGRTNLLAIARETPGALYEGNRNEQFDIVISNPPFSLTMSPDERDHVRGAFPSMGSSISEKIFIERWYQLLSPGGVFCCILPETILDTLANRSTRLFLYQHFKIIAVVALPYDAFRPFTSTKTCIVFAQRRPDDEAAQWREEWSRILEQDADLSEAEVFTNVVDTLGWADDPIFMAEPDSIGYKRRKNLPDLARPNQLFPELNSVVPPEDTVLARFRAGNGASNCARLGFWTDLGRIGTRSGLRLDPKYRWLWDYQHGIAIGDEDTVVPLSTILRLVELKSVKKGDLDEERRLIDLESVESRQAIVSDEAPLVSEIGSNKVRFEGAEMVISKLEPYLGKIIITPDPQWIGTTEWIGLERVRDVPLNALAYFLMLPELCEAYRRLQSGKRHARFVPIEFLDLRVSLPQGDEWQELEARVLAGRAEILSLCERTHSVRAEIDQCFGPYLRE